MARHGTALLILALLHAVSVTWHSVKHRCACVSFAVANSTRHRHPTPSTTLDHVATDPATLPPACLPACVCAVCCVLHCVKLERWVCGRWQEVLPCDVHRITQLDGQVMLLAAAAYEVVLVSSSRVYTLCARVLVVCV